MPKAKKPRQQELIPNREIVELKKLALDYVDVRDERMGLTEREVDLKSKILSEMHKHKLETYRSNGVEIRVVKEEEKLKVKVSEKKEAEEIEV